MKVSKGIEFQVMTIPGVGHMSGPGEDEKEAVRVFYVATARAIQLMLVWLGLAVEITANALTKNLQTSVRVLTFYRGGRQPR